MSLNKVNYVNNQTVIGADNLNAIQDEIIANSNRIDKIMSYKLPLGVEYGGTGATDVATARENLGIKTTVRNILDNSDFTNPVNQRGEISYTSNNINLCYGIDRWFGADNEIVTVENGYLNFKSVNGENAHLIQVIESNKIENGKKYTLVCELLDGSTFLKIITASIGMGYDGISIGQNSSVFFSNDSNLSTLYFVGFWTTSTDGVNIKNVALYEGEYTADNLPEYQQKGYGVELAECLRYYEKIKYFPIQVRDNANYYSACSRYYPKRCTPTFKYSHVLNINSGRVDATLTVSEATPIAFRYIHSDTNLSNIAEIIDFEIIADL